MAQDGKPNRNFVMVPRQVQWALSAAPFNGTERRIIDVVMRFSYGYGRGTAFLSIDKLCHHTGLSRRTVRRSLSVLIESNVIFRGGHSGRRASELAVNPNPDGWGARTPVVCADWRIQSTEAASVVCADSSASVRQSDRLCAPIGAPCIESEIDTKIETRSSRFEEFWERYPRGDGTREARKAFDALSAEDQERAVIAAANYAAHVVAAGIETQFTKQAKNFIREGVFDDFQEPLTADDDPTIRCGLCGVELSPAEQLDAPWDETRGYCHDACAKTQAA